MFDDLPIRAEFFLRRANYVQPRTLIAGLLHSVEVPENPNDCQLVLGSLIIVPQRRFLLPKFMAGWTVEDLLMENINTSTLKELPL